MRMRGMALLGSTWLCWLAACSDGPSREGAGGSSAGATDDGGATNASDASASRAGTGASGATARAGTGGSSTAGAGSSATPVRDAGGGSGSAADAGEPLTRDWEPLEATATPACTHPAAPSGFVPALIVELFQDSAREPGAVDLEGRYVSLRCPEHPYALRAQLSPDRSKLLYGAPAGTYVTSWLLEGVFALPSEVDGLTVGNYFWANDDYLVADATRMEPGTGELAERALVLVRWDGSAAKRLDGAVRVDESDNDLAQFMGANERFGAYRLDGTPEPGFEYYRVDFPALTSTLIASAVGEGSARVDQAFHGASGRLLLAGDQRPFNFDSLYFLDVEHGELIDLESYTEATAALSPDGEYAVWRVTNAFESQPLRAGSTKTRYDALYHTSLLEFDPGGHRFASTTDAKELVIVDPETGNVSPVLHAPLETGAAGIETLAFAPDGAGVYFIAALSMSAKPALYYSPLAGPARELAPAGAAFSLLPSPDGDHLLMWDGQRLQLVGRDGTVRVVPLPSGVDRTTALTWSSSSRIALLRGSSLDGIPVVLIWPLDQPQSRDLLAGIKTGFGGPPTAMFAAFSLLR